MFRSKTTTIEHLSQNLVEKTYMVTLQLFNTDTCVTETEMKQ